MGVGCRNFSIQYRNLSGQIRLDQVWKSCRNASSRVSICLGFGYLRKSNEWPYKSFTWELGESLTRQKKIIKKFLGGWVVEIF